MRGPRRGPPRGRPLPAWLLLLLLLPLPAGGWYKHVASPRYHTVGRAAGLLAGLRRSPHLRRRAGDTLVPEIPGLGLGAFPPGPSARDTLSLGPADRDALLLPSGVQELREASRRSARASTGLLVRAPRSPRALELAPRLGAHSWTSAEPARAFGEMPWAQPGCRQRKAFAGPRLAPGPP